jgi:hypothetical protein
MTFEIGDGHAAHQFRVQGLGRDALQDREPRGLGQGPAQVGLCGQSLGGADRDGGIVSGRLPPGGKGFVGLGPVNSGGAKDAVPEARLNLSVRFRRAGRLHFGRSLRRRRGEMGRHGGTDCGRGVSCPAPGRRT